ncbi:acetyltransferase [Acrocarpospora phusangensis]|uniref:Acetyltransferase n=1 Tax=Acrocarpospora phusangensis TaxID=1070424 RepID=A0A919Q8D9_9ACTN|nr:acetyltransferase [Acrocarpospora phusangensis]
MIVRPYAEADQDAVVGVWSRSARLAHPFVDGEGVGARADEMREVHLRQADMWVALDETGEIVGLLGLLGAEIGGLFVDPPSQGRGIGRLLVEHAAAIHGELTVEVYELNERACGFYRRMGFVPFGSRVESETGLTLLQLRR